MGSFTLSTGRGVCVARLLVVLLFAVALFGARPSVALAQDFEAMLPETLHAEMRKVESEYRQAIQAVNAAEAERVAKKAAGAAEADLRALDEKVGQLVSKAEKLKVQADYLEELYQSQKREYKTR